MRRRKRRWAGTTKTMAAQAIAAPIGSTDSQSSEGAEAAARQGCSDPKREGCGDPKRLGCSDPKRLGCSDPKRPGCSDPKRDLSNATSRYPTFDSCAVCRRTSYAKACTKSTGETLRRYQEWALPFLRNRIAQNDLIMRVFVVVGLKISDYTAGPRQTILCAGRQRLEMKPHLRPETCIHECDHQTWNSRECVTSGYVKLVGAVLQLPKIELPLQESLPGNNDQSRQVNINYGLRLTSNERRRHGCEGGGHQEEIRSRQSCFFCKVNVLEYKPYQLEDEYGAYCFLCRRYTCSNCCHWELRKAYCTWCAEHGPTISVEHRRMNSRGRAVSRGSRDWKETVDWLDMFEFVRNAVVDRSRELPCAIQAATLDATMLQHRRGTDLKDHVAKCSRRQILYDAREIVYGLLLSKYGDENRATGMFAQNWVPGWEGWRECMDAGTDEEYMQLMNRFEVVARANMPVNLKSNRARVAELETQGLTLVVASPHGANNCLIDSLLLGLLGSGIRLCPADVGHRQRVCAACRAYLETEYGIEEGTYLDGHRDGPRILAYLLATWPRAIAVRVRFYDRFDQSDFDEELREELHGVEFTRGPPADRAQCELSVFNHAHSNGDGYHFDLLWTSNTFWQHLMTEREGPTPPNKHIETAQGDTHVAAVTLPTVSQKEKPTDSTSKRAQRHQEHANTSAAGYEACENDMAGMQWRKHELPDGETRQVDGIEQMDTAPGPRDTQELPLPVLPSHPAPIANPSYDHMSAAAAAVTTAAHAVASESELRTHLQNFLNSRSQAPIQVCPADVTLLQVKWNNMAEVGAQLQVWLGASLVSFEPTRKNAHVLAKQWMRYYAECTPWNEHSQHATEPGKNNKEKSPHQRASHRDLAWEDVAAPTSNLDPACEIAATPPATQEPNTATYHGSKQWQPMKRSSKQTTAKHKAVVHMTAPAGSSDRKRIRLPSQDKAKDSAKPCDGNVEGSKRPAPKRRYTKKAPQDMEEVIEKVQPLEQDEYSLATWAHQHGNPDPRMEKETAIRRLAAMLRSQPMLPHGMEASDPAFDLPNWHCAFKDCEFEALTYADLTGHILHQHVAALRQVTDLKLPPLAWEEAGMEAYRAAITCVCQDAAPLAHSAIDRRCLRQFQAAKDGDNIGTAICFVCAQRFPYVDTQQHAHGNRIQWRRLVNAKTDEFLNLPRAQAEEWFGYDAYKRNYATQHEPDAQAQLEDELQEWQTTIQFTAGAPLRVICCPEDKVCRTRCPPDASCPMCRAPVCQFCWNGVTQEKVLPATALANDMLVFYAPKMIYQLEVTFMELICASPCFTAMCCFSLEKRLLGDRALDQDAFMPRQRLAARGNATTFPLAWEDILQHLEAAEAGTLSLPRTGVELAETVSVVLKSMQASNDVEGLGKVIHQARVRRAVVLRLLQEAKARGHPAYKHINMLEASTRAETLPEDGIPDEIIAVLPYDDDLANVQRQKAATPVRENLTLEGVAEELGNMCKPNAVVNEKSSGGIGDTNAQQVAALEALQRGANAGAGDGVLTVSTGNRLLDQFQPWYFAFAFAYVFPFCTAMPDPPAWHAKPRYRRVAGAPRVELESWVRCMARRCEAQINRDWVFGFVSWNLLFRSTVNLSRTVHTYGTPVYDEQTRKFRTLTARDIEAGAVQLVRALNAQYIDATGKPRPVNGDMSKLPYVRNLTPAARKLLQNMRHTARQLPGTQEARRQMRFEIEAMRIRYGVPLFVTFSPDESHQLVYIRMCRTRRSDPVRSASVWQEWQCGEREFPPLDENRSLPIAVESVQRLVPCWEQRRRVLARDPLASVDGFHTLALLLLKYIFGLHMCPHCPNCATTWQPCTDTAGSNATVVGGVFGRVDAAYISIEAQKSTGSLHAHCQVFVQCLHQHTPLTEIFQLVESRLDSLRSAYLQYNTHVVHMTYAGQTEEQTVDGIDAAEHTWPEHAMDSTMTACPEYLRARAPTRDVSEAEQWARAYLEHDVVALQYLKQHHYHPIDPETGERKPLRGCEKKDRPGVCKSDFPRAAWLCDEAVVLCPCELRKHGFPDHGRKNRLGALFGPCAHPWLNACHPALLAAARGANVDVQVPYRLPFACATCGRQLTLRFV